MFSQIERSRGTGPRATVKKNVPHTVGRGPVPRHAVGHSCAPHSIGQEHLLLTRSGSGEPELRSLGHANARGGQAPALRARDGFSSRSVGP